MSHNRFFVRMSFLAIIGGLICLMAGCQGLAKAPAGGTPTGNSLQTSVNHIVFMAQENRSFDHYFGAMRQYWADYGYPDQAFDGLAAVPHVVSGRPCADKSGVRSGVRISRQRLHDRLPKSHRSVLPFKDAVRRKSQSIVE